MGGFHGDKGFGYEALLAREVSVLGQRFLARELLLSQKDFHGHGPRNEAL